VPAARKSGMVRPVQENGSLQMAKTFQTCVSIAANDDVVVNADAQRPRDLLDFQRHADICLGRRGITGWVVVDEDQRSRG
jgi:hypothetical protein